MTSPETPPEAPKDTWIRSLREATSTIDQFVSSNEQIEKCIQFSKILIEAYKNGQTVFSCGNGGSHCDAMHFAEELTGRYRKDRRPLGALALGDSSHVTCVSNDYGFTEIFSRQLEGLARKGDVLITLSTSGNSENLIKALAVAKQRGIKSIALLGRDGGRMKGLADLSIVVPATTSDRIQEVHIKLIHTVIETVERALFADHYN